MDEKNEKYTTPSLKVTTAFSTDIIQISGEEVAVLKEVITGSSGETVTATGYTSSDFASVYGSNITSVTE